MNIPMSNELAEMRKAIQAEEARLRSPEAIAASVDEFERRTGYQGNDFANATLLRHLGDAAPTVENLEAAAARAVANEVPINDLRRYLVDQELLTRGR